MFPRNSSDLRTAGVPKMVGTYVPRVSLTVDRCSTNFVKMSDKNYREVLHYYRRCLLMAKVLRDRDKIGYIGRINDLLQETWYDFVWRTELPETELIGILEAKENMKTELVHKAIGMAQTHMVATKSVLSPTSYTIILVVVVLLIIVTILAIWRTCTSTDCTDGDGYKRERRISGDTHRDGPPSISASSLLLQDDYYFEELTKDGGRPPPSSLTDIRRLLKTCCYSADSEDEDNGADVCLPSSGVGVDSQFLPMLTKMRDLKKGIARSYSLNGEELNNK